LQGWVNENMKVIKAQASQEEQPELAQCVYSMAMEDIIQQVSVECKERGNLLAHVWKSSILNKGQEDTKKSTVSSFNV